MVEELNAASRYPYAAAWRDGLVGLRFIDDGSVLTGSVGWQDRRSGDRIARVEVTLGDGFPFTPPVARILAAGAEIDLSFHRARDGSLCLWEEDWSVDDAPWLSPAGYLTRIAGWFGGIGCRLA